MKHSSFIQFFNTRQAGLAKLSYSLSRFNLLFILILLFCTINEKFYSLLNTYNFDKRYRQLNRV